MKKPILATFCLTDYKDNMFAMASNQYQIHFQDQADQEIQEVRAEDFRVFGSAVVFFRHIRGDKANTHLFRLEDISSIELKDSAE